MREPPQDLNRVHQGQAPAGGGGNPLVEETDANGEARAGDRCVQIVSCVIVWLTSIRLVRLVHRRLFTFEKRRVFALRTREKGRQSRHYG
jgi:hypothetical protein